MPTLARASGWWRAATSISGLAAATRLSTRLDRCQSTVTRLHPRRITPDMTASRTNPMRTASFIKLLSTVTTVLVFLGCSTTASAASQARKAGALAQHSAGSQASSQKSDGLASAEKGETGKAEPAAGAAPAPTTPATAGMSAHEAAAEVAANTSEPPKE